MGWNSWNKFGCDGLNADVVKKTTDLIIELKLNENGYNYVNIDDCWQADERDQDGHIMVNSTKFPDGIKDVADYVHSKGLKFGIYSSRGSKTCAGKPGGQGYEVMDANDYASWGVDYLKYDNCFIDGTSAKEQYTTMSNALNATGREIFFSLCNWGNENVAEWGP